MTQPANRTLNDTTRAPRVKRGALLPSFVLLSTQGGQSGPGSFRSKYNLVVAFLEGAAEGRAYLQALAGLYPEILSRQARLLAVVPLPLENAKQLASSLGLRYPLLADPGASTTRRMLGGDDPQAGTTNTICVADRFGEVVDVTPVASVDETRAVLEWLDYIQIQCPE